MLRIIQSGNSLPHSWPVDPSATFQPGQCMQLTVVGNQIMATVSDGTNPLGIVDDIKATAFTAPAWNESVIVPATGVLNIAGKYVTPVDIKIELANPNIVQSTFISLNVPVLLNPRNGVITFPAGTELNLDLDGDSVPDAIKTIVNYQYMVPGMIGDDSTIGSNRCTIWFQRMILNTDQYDTTCSYPVNAHLFVNESGYLTTKQITEFHPAVGMVTAPPNVLTGSLELIWL